LVVRNGEADLQHSLYSGAAIWTAIIKQDEFINKVQVEGKKPLGIVVSAGPALCESFATPSPAPDRTYRLWLRLKSDLTWVAFAFSLLSIVPYLVSCCTYRRN